MARDFKPIAASPAQWDFKPMEKPTFIELLQDRIEADPELNETALAIKAGLDKSTVRQMIKLNRSPRLKTAQAICEALGTTYEEFMAEALSEEERLIHDLVRRMSPQQRRRLLGFGEGLLDGGDPSQSEDPPTAE